MSLSPENIKATLLNLVSQMQDNPWQYCSSPTDFTRNRKISFTDTILSTISMQKSSSKKELLKYFDFSSSAPTASALIQQRKKISPDAFASLLSSFNQAFPPADTVKGYDPIAVDGSDIHIHRNPKDTDTYRITDVYGKGFNMEHLNAAYHLRSHQYLDVIIQPMNKSNEYLAMCDIIDHYAENFPERKPVFIADRGYVAFNVFAHAIENNAYFLIRARDSQKPGTVNMLSTLNLPDSPEFDIKFERWLTRRRTKTVLAEPEIYKSIGKRLFDYLDPKSRKLYYICFRIVRFVLPDGKQETIYTNLPPEDFTLDELKSLYYERWGIETAFRDLKYAAGLLYFHSKRKELILQEIYAKIILYNYSELITGAAVAKQKELKRRYAYQINFSVAIAICTEYLIRSGTLSDTDVIALLTRELVPVRKRRSSPRYLRARTATSFQYR